MRGRTDTVEMGVTLFIVVFVVIVAIFGGFDLRLIATALGVVAFAGVVARTIGYWQSMTYLERILGGLLSVSVLIGSFSTHVLEQHHVSSGLLVWSIIIHRLLTWVCIALWPWLVDVERPWPRLRQPQRD